jgi:hypothetical protein
MNCADDGPPVVPITITLAADLSVQSRRQLLVDILDLLGCCTE